MDKVIILGNDHTNTLGLVQSMGCLGFRTFVYSWGKRTGIVKSSKYTTNFHGLSDVEACIKAIVDDFTVEANKIPILCSCDGAALAIEAHQTMLKEKFLFEHCCGNYTLSQLSEKNLQVKLAESAGFNIPKSIELTSLDELPKELPFYPPYIYKALKSVEGDKGDLTICRSIEDLREKLSKTLTKTHRVLIQQYIERDFEISVLGCATTSGACIIPAIENKLTLYPRNVGLECLSYIEPLTDHSIIDCIKSLLAKIKYVGLFSVEMMHCKNDGKFYFTEINLRNDGANNFIRKYGFNLPAFHIEDLTGIQVVGKENLVKREGFYIWEMHHFYSMLKKDISFKQWLSEIRKTIGWLVFDWKDIVPFIKQFSSPITDRMKLTKGGNY